MRSEYDAVVVGAGPNGLAAAITIAREGYSVLLLEGKESLGGGSRSAELTLPGYRHDVCATIFGLARSSPFFKELPLEDHGVEWITPPAALAHPLDDGSAVIVERSLEATAEMLGRDNRAYRNLLSLTLDHWEVIIQDLLGPLSLPPRRLWLLARFGKVALISAEKLVKQRFTEQQAKALFAGMAAHSMLSLDKALTSAFGIILNSSAHATGWPVVKGGAQKFVDALAKILCLYGGEIITGRLVESVDELPAARANLFDVTPRQLLSIAGDQMPTRYRRQLLKYRYGPGIFKLDMALDGPIPWKDENCLRCATVHVGGSAAEIATEEKAVSEGKHPDKPFVILAQTSLFDATRAPAAKHTVWAYCHVPNGSMVDMTERILTQIERFAPGFRDRIIAQHAFTTADLESYNPNYIGGDINGGIQDIWQQFARPTFRWVPYSTPLKGIYLCSSSTPPGGGVHGMCGYHAAKAVLRRELRH
jgi:phytoene dehydrogenase-like protein